MCDYGKETVKLQENVARHKNICYTVRAGRKSLSLLCSPLSETVRSSIDCAREIPEWHQRSPDQCSGTNNKIMPGSETVTRQKRGSSMRNADSVTKEYMKQNTIFADAFNFFLYGGKQVIDPVQRDSEST